MDLDAPLGINAGPKLLSNVGQQLEELCRILIDMGKAVVYDIWVR